MITVTESVIIHCPPASVFNTAADPEQQLKWDAGHFTRLKALTPGPPGKGSKYRCYIPWLGSMTYEFVAFDPPHSFAHRSRMMINYGHHVFEFAGVEGGTELRQTMEVRPRGIGYLLYPVMKPLLRKSLQSLGTGLKKYMEATVVKKNVEAW